MSEPQEVFWTVGVRWKGETEMRTVQQPKRETGAPLLGEPDPDPETCQHGLRHKAVGVAIAALLAGAEAVEIFRFPPLGPEYRKRQKQPNPQRDEQQTEIEQ